MPPKKITTPIPALLKDLEPFVQATVQTFHKVQSQLVCTKCTKLGTMVHIHNTTTTPPKPVFECNSCSNRPFLQTMQKEIQQAVSQPSTGVPIVTPSNTTNPPPIDMAFGTNGKRLVFGVDAFKPSSSLGAVKPVKPTAPRKPTGTKRTRRISDDAGANPPSTTTDTIDWQQLAESLQARLTALEKAHADLQQQFLHTANKNAQIEQQLLQQQKTASLQQLEVANQQQQPQQQQPLGSEDVDMSSSDFPALTTTSTTTTAAGSSGSKWANAPKAVTETNASSSPARQLSIAVRALTAPSPDQSQGFSYVYYPAKSRISRKTQRSNLSTLGVTNSRVLDIHYPSRNVVAILVHNDYRNDLITTLQATNVHHLEMYSPTDPTSLSDPQYQDLSDDEKRRIATDKHNQRLVRALPFIRTNVCRAVARCFANEGTGFYLHLTTLIHLYGGYHSLMRTLNIACINANGRLRQEAIDSVLYHSSHTDLLFITETWLAPSTSLPTHWAQYHIYGSPVIHSHRHQMGISLFINPSFTYTKLYVDTQTSPYYMICHLDSLKIYCFYLPPHPSFPNASVMSLLESVPLTPNTIFCGDFNARMGKYSGDLRWNTRGSSFAKYIRHNSLFNWNSKLQYGIPTRINYYASTNQTESSIVDYFLSQSDLIRPSLDIRTDLAVLGSDHKLMTLSFVWDDLASSSLDEPPPEPFRKRWKTSRLDEPDVRNLYIQTVQQQFHHRQLNSNLRTFLSSLTADPANISPSHHADNVDTIERLSRDFYDSIYHALDTIVTPLTPRPKTWNWFWTASLQATANLRQAYYHRWRKSCGIQKPILWAKYKQVDHQLKQEVRIARSSAYRKFCDKLDNDPHTAIPTIKRLVQAKTRSTHRFSSVQGPQHAVNEMAHYLETIYSGQSIQQPKNLPIHIKNELLTQTKCHSFFSPTSGYDMSTCPFTTSQTITAIKQLPRNKTFTSTPCLNYFDPTLPPPSRRLPPTSTVSYLPTMLPSSLHPTTYHFYFPWPNSTPFNLGIDGHPPSVPSLPHLPPTSPLPPTASTTPPFRPSTTLNILDCISTIKESTLSCSSPTPNPKLPRP
ncbi:MAG: hypothetical protein EXX96DRAFT_612576 [Benjaminiella poitrasii]|nr:MAG: hypothetical protein EXX96DRAFT_612576 [Benjaminiella poitrasii]